MVILEAVTWLIKDLKFQIQFNRNYNPMPSNIQERRRYLSAASLAENLTSDLVALGFDLNNAQDKAILNATKTLQDILLDVATTFDDKARENV